MVIQTLNRNTQLAQDAIRLLARNLVADRNCDCESALATALITDPSAIPAETKKKLGPLIQKYIGK